MNKKHFALTLLLALALAGCQKDKTAPLYSSGQEGASSSQAVSSSQEEESQAPEAKDTDETRDKLKEAQESDQSQGASWNQEKDQELSAYIKEWEKGLGQTYDQCWPGREGDMYGLSMPSYALGHGMIYEGGLGSLDPNDCLPIGFTWSETGTEAGQYNVVACYTNGRTGEYLKTYTYLFVIYNGQPMTLVTDQNQGGLPNGVIVFRTSENAAIQNKFAQLAQAD